MNYYEHHLGDYDGATAHLSWLEDCAYRRLICLYYRNESPIPVDIKQACRLVRASSKLERDAVEQVLSEFFTLKETGWHHLRCDEEISEYQEREPEREAKRENAKERQRRARARRSELFEKLRGHNVVPDWDTSTKQLEAMLSQYESQTSHAHVTRDDTATQSHSPLPNPSSHSKEQLTNPNGLVGDSSGELSPACSSDGQASSTAVTAERTQAKPARRGTTLPADFSPDETGKALAREMKLHHSDLEKFKDHHTAKGSVMKDWQAAWRTWCRNAASFGRSTTNGSGQPRTEDFSSKDYGDGIRPL